MADRVVDAVIFDLGGVIMRNGKPSDFTRRYGNHDPAYVAELVMGPHHADTDHPWHRVERGEITLAECRALTKALLDDAGVVPTEPAPPPPAGARGIQFELNHDMVRFIHDLRDASIPIGILTNNVREFRDWWWPLMDFEATFDVIVDSHEVGMRKPNPAIYRHTLEVLGAIANRTAFLDDLVANVDAANALGIHGIVVGDDSTPAISRARDLTGVGAAA